MKESSAVKNENGIRYPRASRASTSGFEDLRARFINSRSCHRSVELSYEFVILQTVINWIVMEHDAAGSLELAANLSRVNDANFFKWIDSCWLCKHFISYYTRLTRNLHLRLTKLRTT